MLTVECPRCCRDTGVEPDLLELRCEECGVVERIAPDADATELPIAA